MQAFGDGTEEREELQVELEGWSTLERGDVRRAVELVLRDAGLLPPCPAAEVDDTLSA